MLVLLLCILVLVCIIPIFKVIKDKKVNIKNRRVIIFIISIIVLVIIGFGSVKIYPKLPHNDVSKKDRIAIEEYILDKYGLELKVTESTIAHRGDFGINPGIGYYFVLKNRMGFEYRLNIDSYTDAEIDLKKFLAENPELDLVQMKQFKKK